jgi:hypothetical protein
VVAKGWHVVAPEEQELKVVVQSILEATGANTPGGVVIPLKQAAAEQVLNGVVRSILGQTDVNIPVVALKAPSTAHAEPGYHGAVRSTEEAMYANIPTDANNSLKVVVAQNYVAGSMVVARVVCFQTAPSPQLTVRPGLD